MLNYDFIPFLFYVFLYLAPTIGFVLFSLHYILLSGLFFSVWGLLVVLLLLAVGGDIEEDHRAAPPGSKGAYSKFVDAQVIARLAVGGMEE